MRFYMCHLRVVSLVPTALQLSCTQALLAFKAKHSGTLSSQCRIPRLESLMWGSDPSLLGENLCNCNYHPICGSPTQEYES